LPISGVRATTLADNRTIVNGDSGFIGESWQRMQRAFVDPRRFAATIAAAAFREFRA